MTFEAIRVDGLWGVVAFVVPIKGLSALAGDAGAECMRGPKSCNAIAMMCQCPV